MRRESSPHSGPTAPIPARAAWWIAVLATLIAVLGLGAARSAQALTIGAPNPATSGALLPLADFDDEEEGEEEFEFESCEVFEEEGEEEEVCEEDEGEETTPPECLLSSAEATVSASPVRGTVRLAVRYTSRTSAAVNVDLKLRGRKGSLSLGGEQQRFKRAGVYRETERLSDLQMAKVIAAKSFTIELQAVNTPRYCHRYFDRQLTVKRASGASLTWSAPAARSGA